MRRVVQCGPQKSSTTRPQSEQARELGKRARIDLSMAISQDDRLEQTNANWKAFA